MTTKKSPAKLPAKKVTKKVVEVVDELTLDESYVLPSGYQVVKGDNSFYDSVEWEVTNLLEGVVLEIKEVVLPKKKKGQVQTTRIMAVEQANGHIVNVWEKNNLTALFEAVQPGTKIHIKFLGKKDVGQPMPMYVFRTGIMSDGPVKKPVIKKAVKKVVKKSV